MSQSPSSSPKDQRRAREADALRENLAKRKQQERRRQTTPSKKKEDSNAGHA
jgi:hypothetical protein